MIHIDDILPLFQSVKPIALYRTAKENPWLYGGTTALQFTMRYSDLYVLDTDRVYTRSSESRAHHPHLFSCPTSEELDTSCEWRPAPRQSPLKTRRITCPSCRGSKSPTTPCFPCSGTEGNKDCLACDGHGYLVDNTEECDLCNGIGKVQINSPKFISLTSRSKRKPFITTNANLDPIYKTFGTAWKFTTLGCGDPLINAPDHYEMLIRIPPIHIAKPILIQAEEQLITA